MATQLQGDGARLFVWDHSLRHCTVRGCREWVQWPDGDTQDPMCVRCWDAMSEIADPDSDGHHPLTPAEMLRLYRDAIRVLALPRSQRGDGIRALAARYGVQARTVYRKVRNGEPTWVEAFDRRALFVMRPKGPARVTRWVAS